MKRRDACSNTRAMRRVAAVALMLCAGILPACGGGPPRTTGFLSTYSNLQPAGESGMLFRGHDDALRQYSAFIIDPVQILFTPQPGSDLTRADLDHVATYFRGALINSLTPEYQVVSGTGPGVARFRIAISDIESSTWWLNVHPLSRATGVGAGAASVEAELVDSMTGEQLAALVETQSGSRLGFNALTRMGDAKGVIDRWVLRVEERLREVHGRCDPTGTTIRGGSMKHPTLAAPLVPPLAVAAAIIWCAGLARAGHEWPLATSDRAPRALGGGPFSGSLFESWPLLLSVMAQDADPAAGPEAAPGGEVNTGQDPTRPLTRIDLRLKHIDLPGGFDTQLLTLRADKPFMLGGGWQLSTRLDLPFMLTDVPSRDNPNGDHEYGMADSLFQGLLITPPLDAGERWVMAFGTQVLFPTGSHDQMGTGKWQLAPTVAVRAGLPEVSPGSFFALIVRDQFSFAGAGDRRDINDLVIQPIINFQLPDNWFITMAPEMRFNLEEGGDAFIPFDIQVGKMIRPGVVGSVQFDVPIVDDYEQYDWQVEFRIGFFF